MTNTKLTTCQQQYTALGLHTILSAEFSSHDSKYLSSHDSHLQTLSNILHKHTEDNINNNQKTSKKNFSIDLLLGRLEENIV